MIVEGHPEVIGEIALNKQVVVSGSGRGNQVTVYLVLVGGWEEGLYRQAACPLANEGAGSAGHKPAQHVAGCKVT